jgi:tRNA A-37 threonylcarbamoyl transferase component Bud32
MAETECNFEGWNITDERIGMSSAYAQVYKTCKKDNCNYIAKKQSPMDEWDDIDINMKNEVDYQNRCAELGLCVPIDLYKKCGKVHVIIMSKLDKTVADIISDDKETDDERRRVVLECANILKTLAKDANIIHGDCHIGNFMRQDKTGKIYAIDFGKAFDGSDYYGISGQRQIDNFNRGLKYHGYDNLAELFEKTMLSN